MKEKREIKKIKKIKILKYFEPKKEKNKKSGIVMFAHINLQLLLKVGKYMQHRTLHYRL